MGRGLLAGVAIVSALLATSQVHDDWQAAADRISADSLRGHVSFLASDLLEGRGTPSRGLDIAAEYIAAQFRRAGLEPAGDDGYFQTATWRLREPNPECLEFVLHSARNIIRPASEQLAVLSAAALAVEKVSTFRVTLEGLQRVRQEEIEGKAILIELRSGLREWRRLQSELSHLKPLLVVVADPDGRLSRRIQEARLVDPDDRPVGETPVLAVRDAAIAELFGKLDTGAADVTISASWAAPLEKTVRLRNVVGVLRGSDPVLRDTAVLVSAHYDHLGMLPPGEGDRVFNGANDDASGTASVMELAGALSILPHCPKRSIVFVAYFGEEKGMLGSRYYVRHPPFPIERTVAAINIEHVGRTDSSEGPQVGSATLTGFDYSDIGRLFARAGELAGIRVYKDTGNSDGYFSRSDNVRLAEMGVPAHSVTTAFDFPDYHKVGDHWDKLDYNNLAKINRMIALGLLMIADNPEPPKWDESNARARRYHEAWKGRKAQ